MLLGDVIPHITPRSMEWKSRLFKSRLSKDLKFRKTLQHAPPVNRAEKIAILWTETEPPSLEKIKKLSEPWQAGGVTVELFTFFKKKVKKDETLPGNGIGQNDINWFGIPKWDKIQGFVDQAFDILIVPDPNPAPPVLYILSQSAAHFKVGPASTPSDALHLRIEHKGDFNLDIFWKDLSFLLEKLSTKS